MAHTQWNSLMQGVIGQECRGDGCMPLRFTPAQMAVYADDPGYHACSQGQFRHVPGLRNRCGGADPGRRCFRGSTRDIWSFDLLVDRRLFAHREGSVAQEPHMSWRGEAAPGPQACAVLFPLPGQREQQPPGMAGRNGNLPVVPQKRLLCLGDSITQGYTVHFPSLSYAARLARRWTWRC